MKNASGHDANYLTQGKPIAIIILPEQSDYQTISDKEKIM